METLDPESLASSLVGLLSPELILKLKSQNVDGNTFLNLSPQTLILFGFNLKDVTDISHLLQDIQNKKVVLEQTTKKTCEAGSNPSKKRTSHEIGTSGSESNDDKHNESQDKHNESTSAGSEKSSDNEAATNIDEKFKPLEEYVEKTVLNSSSEYELLNMLGKLNRWESLRSNGMACTSLPNLGVPLLKSIQERAGNKKETSKKPPRNQNKKESASVAQRQEKSIEQNKVQQQPLGAQLRSSNKKSEDTSKSNVATSSRSAAHRNPNDSDQSSEREDSSGSDITQKENLLKPTFPLLPRDELLAVLPNLPSFEVEDILLSDDKAKKWVPYLKEGYLLPTSERKLVFRVLMHHLIHNHAGNIKDVSTLMKHGMAKSIVTTYGQYQSPSFATNSTPWAHIYNPKKNSGNLANIMKRAQTALPLADRVRKGRNQKRKTKKKRTKTCNINIEALAVMMPDSDHKEEIFDGMEKTFDIRCEDRRNGISITAMVEKFPQFLNYSGELISLEFKLQHPKAEDMCVTMASLIPKVIENWKDSRINPTCQDNTIKAFMILASRLPHAIARKMGPAFPKKMS